MDLEIPPLKIENLLESNLLKSRFLVPGLAVLPASLFRYHTFLIPGSGVCEMNTHPTRASCRSPSFPSNVNVHAHAEVECSGGVK